ncbi:hypothetical protein, partial [Actinophytocola sp.]|uniref:ATP-binding protein n=1 Tax=Actinophytocola sp. TaxID=1872138 RepID=UPI00389A9F9C
MTASRTVRLGTFDVERRWRPAGLAQLPAVRDPDADRTAAAMDELLAWSCEPGDVLVTGEDVPASFLALLGGFGIEVTHRVAPPAAEVSSVEGRLLGAAPGDLYGGAFRPYAVLPETAPLVAAYGLRTPPADLATVCRVSSKSWSNALVCELGLPGAGVLVDSVPALVDAVARFDGAPVLLKDPYGVGGRGIIEVSSPRVLNTVCRVLTRQAERGLAVELLVQRKLDKVADFSAQFDVTPRGRVDWRGVQAFDNVGFSHVGTRPPAAAVGRRLDEVGYRAVMTDVGAALASAGYHGPVCVDAMMLRDGTVVPVLEVNPRMSVGLLTMLAARRLTGTVTGARLAVRTVRCGDDAWQVFDDLLAHLRARDVLLSPGGTGLLPLAVNTLRTSRGKL